MAREITDTEANNPHELDDIRSIGGHEVEKVAILSFRALQLYRIAALQAKLVAKQLVVMRNGDDRDGDEIDQLLQKYGE